MTHVAFTCLSILGQHVLEINITVPAEIVNISSFLLCLYINVLTSCIDMARRQTPLPADLASRPFAGRLGGNQEFILDPKNVENIAALKRVPYASPFISLPGIFTPRGFLEPQLWKAAVTEGMGALLQCSWYGARDLLRVTPLPLLPQFSRQPLASTQLPSF
jgi:hypothetical protein